MRQPPIGTLAAILGLPVSHAEANQQARRERYHVEECERDHHDPSKGPLTSLLLAAPATNAANPATPVLAAAALVSAFPWRLIEALDQLALLLDENVEAVRR